MAHPWIDHSRPVYPGTVKEGYLVKSPPLGRKGVKHWRQRWCVFTSPGNEPPCLLYFTDRQAVLTGRMPINRVLLDKCLKLERALCHSTHPHVFALHLPERVFYFSAASHDEMLSWVDALSSHLKLEAQDTEPSPALPPSPSGRATLPRMSTQATGSCDHVSRERSHSLQHEPNSLTSQGKMPSPSIPPPTHTLPAPPLPQRPQELKYSKGGGSVIS